MSDIQNRLEVWVQEGLVTKDQATAIAEFESRSTVTSVELSPWAEVAVYVGLIFGLASGTALFLRGFHGPTPRLIAQALVALVGLFFGSRIIEMQGHSRVRIGSVILAFGTVGAFGLTVDLLRQVLTLSIDSSLLIATALALVVSLWQWRNRDRFAQFLTTVAAAAGFVAAVLNTISLQPSAEVIASLFYVPAVALIAFRNRLRPSLFVFATGTTIASIAAQGFSSHHQWIGCVVGLVTSCAVFALARHERHTSVLVIAGGFAFFDLVVLYGSYIHGGGALAVVFTASVALFAVIYRRVLAPARDVKRDSASEVGSQS